MNANTKSQNSIVLDTQVEIYPNGSILITSDELAAQSGHTDLQIFAKRLSGRMYRNDYGQLVFEPYQKGTSTPSILAKETVGQVIVCRTPKLIKFTLALPVEMSQPLMSMTLLEQSALVSEKLREGLYERMQGNRPTPSCPRVAV